jgi:hypothetical protein
LWLYQRYSRLWENALLSAGWATLYVLCDAGVDAFPGQWRVVLAMCIVLGGLWKPVVAYALFVAAVAYPLYLISIYVMALALALLILSAPAVVRFLPQALWVLVTILLAPAHLTPVVPLLAGLWWGETVGGIVGGGAALWLKISAGMTGAWPDLWQMNGWVFNVERVYMRFHTADSLQTLILIAEPLALDSVMLLFNLLQVLSWAAAGFVVGFLAHHLHSWKSRVRSTPYSAWSAALSLGPGVVLIWAGYVAVPTWLRIHGPKWLDPPWLPAQLLLASVVAWSVDAMRRRLQRPILVKDVRPFVGSIQRDESAPVKSGQAQEHSDISAELLERSKSKRRRRDDSDQDIIMLELD